MNILFTCAGRRNYLINYFKESLQNQGKIFAADMNLTAPAMVDADIAIKVPNIYDTNYISTLKKIVIQNKIDAIISLNDLELPILSKHKSFFEDNGVKVIISNEDVIEIAFDKLKTFHFINKIGLNTPQTFTNLNEAINAINSNQISISTVVKPRWGSASIGIDLPDSLTELELSFKLQQLKLKKSILNTASENDFDNAIIIQERLVGKEFGMDIINDFNGNYIGTFVREKLNMRSGETDKAMSVIDDRFNEIGYVISKNLKHIGTLDCDVFESNGKLYVLELNPRFGGGYPFSHEAGLNTTAMYIEWLKGNNDISSFVKYKEGLIFSKCDRMLKINTSE